MKNIAGFKIKKGFTLVEIIVVIGVIVTLAAMSTFAYSSALKNSRDQRRRVDLEQIRSALEMYRSNQSNGNYPSASQYSTQRVLEPNYISRLPQDPLTKLTTTYIYRPYPLTCDNVSVPSGRPFCLSYIVMVRLEDGNFYFVGPTFTDGQKLTVTPTPIP